MNKNLKRSLIIISLVFLIIISTSSIISANELNSTDETIATEEVEVQGDDGGNELYVDNNVEESGDGSESHPFKTIKEAVNFGNDQDGSVTINIHSGTYNEKEMKITNNMIIKSYDGEVTLDANKRGWFFYSTNPDNNLSLIGLIFKNGIRYDSDDSSDGGVVKTEGHIDVVNCTFEANYGGTGGGINSHNGANIINSTFKNNKAEYNGAGAYVLGGQTNIINCVFDNNFARNHGGGLRVQGSTYIENSTFTNNKASNAERDGYTGFNGHGGAVQVTDGDLNVESSTFINNSAHFSGGAISAGDDSQYSTKHYQLNINNSTFEGNTAAFGAGIEANDGINLTNSVISNNSVPHTVSAKYGEGSGVYVLSGDSILSGNTIRDNTNPDNRYCSEIYSYSGNVAEKDNDWGSGTGNHIKTNNGKTTNTIDTQPSVKKPVINIQTGEKNNKPQKEQETNLPSKEQDSKQDAANAQDQKQTQNANTEKRENAASPIRANVDVPSSGSRNDVKNDDSDNMVKTNTSTNDVNRNTQSNADVGESSQNIQGSEAPSSGSSEAHEISAIKSIASNDNLIPYLILVLVMFLALITGYKIHKEY